MYLDNQKLWKKINKYGIELNRTQKELHYLQLELNNKNIECNEYKVFSRDIKEYQNKNQILYDRVHHANVYNTIYTFLIICCMIDYSTNHTFFNNIIKISFIFTQKSFVIYTYLKTKVI